MTRSTSAFVTFTTALKPIITGYILFNFYIFSHENKATGRAAGRTGVKRRRHLHEEHLPCICSTQATDIRTVQELQYRSDVSTTMIQANQQTSSLSARKQAFESEFSEWITAQNGWVETHGVPGEDLRPW